MDETKTYVRPGLFNEYVKLQVEYISRMSGKSIEEIRTFVESKTKELYKPSNVTYMKTTSPGNVEQVEEDLWSFLSKTSSSIITPSGSIYKSTEEQPSFISNMMIAKLKERKRIKKIMLNAIADKNESLARRCDYQQATIKINCNSLPGGFGSPYNIFYDKGGYNAITSSARSMIARAYTIAEQLLGGNFSWFSEESLINHIILQLQTKPKDEEVDAIVIKYKLRTPTREELFDFYLTTIRRYVPKCLMIQVNKLLSTCTSSEITYLYYYCNLRHIMWNNTEKFKNFIKYVMDPSDATIDNTVTQADIWKVDETILAITTVAFAHELENSSVKTIIDDRPEWIPKLVAYCKNVERKLKQIEPLFEMFVNTDADIPDVPNKPMTLRNTTILSDTDSVIFTAEAWDKWFRGNKEGIDVESYQITSLVIYWLHHSVRHALMRFSIQHGVSPEHRRVLVMKNEFLYPIMLLYATKKTYVGIVSVKEGVILPKPKIDIKGATLRGSTICQKSLDFIQEMITKEILTPSMQGRISADHLIRKTYEFEEGIADSIRRGETTYLKITSLKLANEYKSPDTEAVVVSHRFWQSVFAPIYGDVQAPIKVYIIPIKQPTEFYWASLAESSPKLKKRMYDWYQEKKCLPNKVIINPGLSTIPKELIPLIDLRDIVWHNIQAVHTTLDRININTGGNSNMIILFSDTYGSGNIT